MKVIAIVQRAGVHFAGDTVLFEFEIHLRDPIEKYTVFMAQECMQRLSEALNLRILQ